MTENLCVILADQLSKDISSLKNFRKDKDKILMMEVANEARYVNHHKKKLVLVFSAMRHFAKDMKSQGYSIIYSKIDESQDNFTQELLHISVKKYGQKNCNYTSWGISCLTRDKKNGKDIEFTSRNI